MAAPEKPPLLKFLAIVGVIVGSFGGMFSLSRAEPLIASRDQYVSKYREMAEKIPVQQPGFLSLAEKEADVIYSRRGVALPLAGMNFILSTLLFLGSASALRSSSWGLSAWKFAALTSVPYTILASAFAVVQAREIVASIPDDFSVEMAMHLRILQVLVTDAVMVLYFVACVLYLRRPSIRALFLRPPAA